jgi:hypothetical protein
MDAPVQPSKITNIYDELLRITSLAFPDHSVLTDLEDLSNNSDQSLRAGYGIQPGNGENTSREICIGKYTLQRDFEIVLTREMLSQPGDTETHQEKWKAILEDLHLLLRQICGRVTMGPRADWAFKVFYTGDQGPRSIQAGTGSFSFIEATITAEYSELTTGGI